MKKLLMVYHEPTPYILDLIIALEKTASINIDILFLTENLTQHWNLSLKSNQAILENGLLKTVYQHFIKKKYDVIFLAGWSHPVTLTFLLFAKIFRIPVLVDSDTPFLLPIVIPFWKRSVKRLIYPILFRLPNMFLPGGTKQTKYLKYYGVPERKIILEKMTVDIASIQKSITTYSIHAKNEFRKQYGLTENDIVFLFVGRLIERKGLLEIVKTFSTIHHSKAKCMIVGDGPSKSLLQNVSKNIIYTGRLEKPDIIKIYFMSDIFLLPAHWEPWGLVINEAMAAGKPVITTDQVGCVDDLVVHQKTGLIIKSQSVPELTAAIHYFLNNPEQIERMSQAALALISSWTIEDSAQQIFQALKCVGI